MTRKKLITRSGLVVLALAIVFVAFALVRHRQALAAVEAALQAGERARLVARPQALGRMLDERFGPIRSTENAAPLFVAAAQRLVDVHISGDVPDDHTFPDVDDALRAQVAEAAGAFALIEQAAALPRCRYDTRWDDGFATRMPEIQDALRLRDALRARAAVRMADGDIDGVLDDVRLLGAVAESFREHPTLIAQMVRIAVGRTADEVLRAALPLVPDAFEVWRSHAPVSARGAVVLGLRGEFAWVGGVALPSGDADPEAEREVGMSSWERLLWGTGAARLLGSYQELIEHGDDNYPELIARAEALEAHLEDGDLLTKTVAVRVSPWIRAEAEDATHRAVTEAGARLLAFRRQMDGRLPERLDEIPGVPTDPRSEAPLRLRLEAGEAVIEAADGEGAWRVPAPR